MNIEEILRKQLENNRSTGNSKIRRRGGYHHPLDPLGPTQQKNALLRFISKKLKYVVTYSELAYLIDQNIELLNDASPEELNRLRTKGQNLLEPFRDDC